ncbi:MAG: PLP-dependent aminotransferase family protein [Thermovirgaceae bacterium]|nr:PLP-dependent aminotransferase family protein [Thermovirgaceae bacterium]
MDWPERFNDCSNNRLEDSEIAAIMRVAAAEEALSLAAGEPFAALYPVEHLRESFMRALSSDLPIWGYSNTRAGIPSLRKWIEEWMRSDGLLAEWVTSDNIFITNGSQEGLSLLSECFLDPGDAVLVESPSYPEAFGVFRKFGVECLSVPLLPDGPDVDAMEAILAKHKVKFFYTIPTFQNPTGFSTSDEKKRRILDIAKKHDFLILEDDPYRNLTFEGSPGGTYLHAAGDDERVIYLGSFSKIIAPGLRCGWVISPAPVTEKLIKLRVMGTLCLPELLQNAIMDFVSGIDLPKHLEALSDTYRGHRDALILALREHACPEGLEITTPGGGFFLWGRVPWIRDMSEFAYFAIRNGKVAIMPGDIFFPENGQGIDTIRLSFSKVIPAMAEEGAKRLGEALRKFRIVQEEKKSE